MKIQFASDLHLEFPQVSNMDPLDETDADLIVLAGDIHKHIKGIDYAARLADSRGVPVIYVAGNHEYYGQEYFHTLQAMRNEAAKHENVHFLENSVRHRRTGFEDPTSRRRGSGDIGSPNYNEGLHYGYQKDGHQTDC